MRDSRRWKDKYELSLDNRQIFFLFFGSALVACLVFVVGVMVGKKLEQRDANKRKGKLDPLTLIDRQTKKTTEGPKLTFHAKLIKPDARSRLNVPPEVLETSHLDRPGQVPPARLASGAMSGSVTPVITPVPGKAAAGKAAAKRLEAQRRRRARRYTLQVSSFQSRAEAKQMMSKLSHKGYRPYLVSSSIPGRGVWYRVRLGTYRSWSEAETAKAQLHQKAQLTAYISRRR